MVMFKCCIFSKKIKGGLLGKALADKYSIFLEFTEVCDGGCKRCRDGWEGYLKAFMKVNAERENSPQFPFIAGLCYELLGSLANQGPSPGLSKHSPPLTTLYDKTGQVLTQIEETRKGSKIITMSTEKGP